MLRDTSPGARFCGVPASGSAHRHPANRIIVIGTLLLATGPLAAQTLRLDTSITSTPACSSAKAVHDMRCANYSGFTSRVGGGAEAAAESTRASSTPAADETPLSGTGFGSVLQRGMASWYGPGFHGRTTANGERFDMNDLTAAHKTLPFGTRVLVHNPRTGKEVVVRINDRGPYARGRVIDLSKAAAKVLGINERGHDAVVLRQVPKANAKRGGGGELVASAERHNTP